MEEIRSAEQTFSPIYRPSPTSVAAGEGALYGYGKLNGHVVVDATSQVSRGILKQKVATEEKGRKSVQFNPDLESICWLPEKSEDEIGIMLPKLDEQKRKKILKPFKKALTLIEQDAQKKIEHLDFCDQKVQAQASAIYQHTASEIIKRYEEFLDQLDENSSLENKRILDESSDAMQNALLESLPEGPEQATAFVTFSQKAYPRLRNQDILLIEQFEKDLTSCTEEKLLSLAKDCHFLLQIALKNFDPNNIKPIKIKRLTKHQQDPLLERLKVPYESVPPAHHTKVEKKDTDAENALIIADTMVRNLDNLRKIFKYPSEQIPMALCRARLGTASLSALVASIDAKKILEELKATKFLSSPGDASNDPSYQKAHEYAENCEKIKCAREEDLSKKSLLTDPNEIKKIALEEIWDAAYKSVGIADDVLAVLGARKINKQEL